MLREEGQHADRFGRAADRAAPHRNSDGNLRQARGGDCAEGVLPAARWSSSSWAAAFAKSASAFFGCRQLVSVSFERGLEQLKDSAFAGCESLTQVTLPWGTSAVGRMAFSAAQGSRLSKCRRQRAFRFRIRRLRAGDSGVRRRLRGQDEPDRRIKTNIKTNEKRILRQRGCQADKTGILRTVWIELDGLFIGWNH